MAEKNPASIIEQLAQLCKKRDALLKEFARLTGSDGRQFHQLSEERDASLRASALEFALHEASELLRTSIFLSKKTGRSVAECMAFLQENPFEGFDDAVKKDLVRAQEKQPVASFP